jgi:hypothetical protein
VFDSSLLDEASFKTKIVDLIYLSIKNLSENSFNVPTSSDTETRNFNDQLVLLSAHVMLNLIDEKNNKKEISIDDDHADETRLFFNYLKVRRFPVIRVNDRKPFILRQIVSEIPIRQN